MNIVLVITIYLFTIFGYISPVEEFPKAEITNGKLNATLLLPDSVSGYYQGTRFDWSGVIRALEYKKHSFFGQWFPRYDPKLHDAIMGPVEEFGPLGFDEAKPGTNFVKIGVGALVKPDDRPYSSFTLYPIANTGTWKVQTFKDHVTFLQQFRDQNGYGYLYRKTVRLLKGKAELVLEHSLENTGTRQINTTVYNHNFFLIDTLRTGPEIKVKFPYQISGTGRGLGDYARIKDNEITYTCNLKDREDVFIAGLEGYTDHPKDYDFRIENHRSKAGVRIRADKPLNKLVFWANPVVSCPEPYINISVNPKGKFKWNIRYEFYEIE